MNTEGQLYIEQLYIGTCGVIWYLLEKAMAPHSSTLAWKIPWMEEPGELQSMGSQRVRHNWAPSLSLFTFMHWRRKWQPLENPRDGGAWWAAVYGVTQSRTRLKWLSSSMVSSWLTSWEIFSVFQNDLPFYILTRSIWGFQISPYPHKYLLLLVLLIAAIPISVKYHFILFLMCISLSINDTEHFFMCLLVICIFSLEKYLLKYFAHF